MKVLVGVLALLAAVTLATAVDSCYSDVNNSCGPASNALQLPTCNAQYGAFKGVVSAEMQGYANLHLERSYEYLLASTFFNNYQTNRAGFTKLFRKLSDDAWESSINLIKEITKRGGIMDFSTRSRLDSGPRKNSTVELHELGSMAKALDVEKELAERAFHIHREATRNRDQLHDAAIAHYLEEEFMEKHADRIRNLAGHTNDLKRFIADHNGQDVSLALYLFDEYLAKVA